MRRSLPTFRYILIIVFICAVAAASLIALGQRVGDPDAYAVVDRVEGFVDIRFAGEETWAPLAGGDTIYPGDTVETGPEGSVELKLPDGSAILIGPSSLITICEIGTVEITQLPTNRFELLRGRVRAVVPHLIGGRTYFIIDTENASVGVRGTDFYESFDPDTLTTYVLGMDGCVSMTPSGGAAFDVCCGEETTVSPGVVPTCSNPADDEMMQRTLEEMPMEDIAPPVDTEVIVPPEVTGAFLNGRIDLDFYDDEITLTRDDLTADGVIRIEGSATGGSLPLGLVEISVDGGFTWERAVGVERWAFELRPSRDMLYEIALRATDTGGNASDPMNFGPFEIAYRDIDAETLAREVIDRFFFAVRIGGGSELDDIISDEYDGSLADLFDKNELTDKILEDHEAWPYLDFSYVINQINSETNTIIVTTHWDILLPGGTETGTTRWWMSAEDEYRIVHAEGDWIQDLVSYAGEINMSFYSDTPPCSTWMIITVVAPNILTDIETISVDLETNCGVFVKELDRSSYKNLTGKNDGFAAEFPVLATAGCLPTACTEGPPVWYWAPPQNIRAIFFDYGYDLEKTDRIP